MKIILTRPEADSLKLASLAKSKGFECLISPMLEIILHDIDKHKIAKEAEECDALIATSKHALESLHKNQLIELMNKKPIYVTGNSTANIANSYGFQDIRIPKESSAHSALELILSDYPQNGKLIYFRGEDISLDIKARLEGLNVVEEIISYKALAAENISKEALNAIKTKNIDVAIFYSLRTANIFDEIINKNDLKKYLSNITALCVSNQIANACKKSTWGLVMTSESVSTKSIMDKLKELY